MSVTGVALIFLVSILVFGGFVFWWWNHSEREQLKRFEGVDKARRERMQQRRGGSSLHNSPPYDTDASSGESREGSNSRLAGAETSSGSDSNDGSSSSDSSDSSSD